MILGPPSYRFELDNKIPMTVQLLAYVIWPKIWVVWTKKHLGRIAIHFFNVFFRNLCIVSTFFLSKSLLYLTATNVGGKGHMILEK